jgi:hypothetical protein
MDAPQCLEGRTIGERCEIDLDVRRQRAGDDMRPIRAQLLGGHLPPAVHSLEWRTRRKPLLALPASGNAHGRRDAAAILVDACGNPSSLALPHGPGSQHGAMTGAMTFARTPAEFADSGAKCGPSKSWKCVILLEKFAGTC